MKLKSTKAIIELDRFRLENIEYSLKQSKEFKKDVIRHPGAVVILPILDNGRMVFVSQPRITIEEQLIELPAGTREKGEPELETARRELAEEVGYAAKDWIQLGEIFPAPGFCDEKLFMFVAKGLTPFKLEADPNEEISVCYFDKEQIETLITNGTIRDAKTLALLFKAKLLEHW